MNDFPLMDELDHQILMHRDAHFGSSFPLMLDYYAQEGKGVQIDFELEKIQALALLEKELGINLSDLVLSETEKGEVEQAKNKYLLLRETYENSEHSIAPLIADLILSEEEEPTEEIQALAELKGQTVPALLNLLRLDEFYRPLFPGYGLAPAFAAETLGIIGDEGAIIPLFEALGKKDFFSEEAIIRALSRLGEKARLFLLKRLKAKPLTKENEHAAMVLASFEENEETAQTCLDLLKDEEILTHSSLCAYLILTCGALRSVEDRTSFLKLREHPRLSSDLKEEILFIGKHWNPHI